MKVPCKDCGDRKIGCHAKCERYLEFRKSREKVYEYRKQQAVEGDLNAEKKRNINRKVTRSK